MTLARLVLRSLVYHWRGNCAVFLGVVVGAAVLTGALLVGDSLRGSLADLTRQRLGWVDEAMVAGRFIRAELADAMPAEHACPAILLQGAASTPDHRAGRVVILGVDERFWPAGDAPLDRSFWHAADPEQGGVVLSSALARELQSGVGDPVTLYVQKASAVPRESLLGRRKAEDVLDKLTFPVAAVLADDASGNRFNLAPSPEAPRNAFVPLNILQTRLGLAGQANAIFVGGVHGDLHAALHEHLDLADWGLMLRTPDERAASLVRKLDPQRRLVALPRFRFQGRVPEELAVMPTPDARLTPERVAAYYRRNHPYLSLESGQMLLDPSVAAAALEAANETGLRAGPVLIYLADTISDGSHEVPYSVVAALDPSLPPPLGPFLPPGQPRLKGDEILLAKWPGSPLQAGRGDRVTLTYYQLDRHSRLEKKTADFTVRDLVPLEGPADDPDLTPEFKGITDQLDIRQWQNPPFPYDPERIKPGDANEHFWNRYRTTPKAYVTLAKGKELWGNRFGDLTSIRLAAPAGSETAGADFRRALLANLEPEQGGFVFDPVRARGTEASAGGTDFAGLFLGFSFFLIAAALLLVGLLFRLNLDRRASEIGLLFASGYRRLTVAVMLLAEGALLAAAGALAGCLAGVGYAWLLLDLLRRWWPGAMEQSFLRLHATPTTFVIGFAASFGVSLLTVGLAVWFLARVSPRALLSGETTEENDPGQPHAPGRWSRGIAIAAGVLALMLLPVGALVHDHEMRALTFFGSGALLLTAALAGAWAWMRRPRPRPVTGHGWPAVGRLGVRNAARHPLRSLLTAGLLASAAFLLVAVESFRRENGGDYLDKNSGSGGFALLAESDVPVFEDLNSDRGREDVLTQLRLALQARGLPAAAVEERLAASGAILNGTGFYPFRVRAGDDASCLNLYQPRRPRLLGVPWDLIRRGGFKFTAVESPEGKERQNPWLLLNRTDGDAIPVIGEANTVTWMLKSKLGGELIVPDERGRPVRLRVVGLLQDSIFQSGLLMSEANFLRIYPGQEGYNLFLIDTGSQSPADVKSVLDLALRERGLDVTPTAERVAAFHAVENMYLSTFQALGGLGLLLGALGLAVVLLRGVWERRGELALLRALGYRHRALGWLVLAENGFLLALGLAAGAGAALLAVAPHLVSGEGGVPVVRLSGLFALVLVVGLLAGVLTVRATLRAPLVPALRRE